MSGIDGNYNSFKNLYIDQLIKIIHQQTEQIEAQKLQINALIKSQQTLLESLRPQTSLNVNPLTLNLFNSNIQQSLLNSTINSCKNNAQLKPTTSIGSVVEQFDLIQEYGNTLAQQIPVTQTVNHSQGGLSLPIPALSSFNKPVQPIVDHRPLRSASSENVDSRQSDGWCSTIKKEVPDQSDSNNCMVPDVPVTDLNETNEDEEEMDLSALQDFAAKFKMSRIEMGFTQRDVGVCLGLMQGNDFSQTTLSRFEALNLSYRNMRKLQPLLQRWLDDIQREGRDAVMARVTAFYQQQKALAEEEAENGDVVNNRKRVIGENLIIPDDLPDGNSSTNADSTTMGIRQTQNCNLQNYICTLSNSLSSSLLHGLPSVLSNTSTFSNLSLLTSSIIDQATNNAILGYTNNPLPHIPLQKKRRKRHVWNEEIKSKMDQLSDGNKVGTHASP